MIPADVAAATAAAITVAMVVLWLVSVRRRDVSIVDLFWGPGFLLVGAVAWLQAPESTQRATVVLALVAAWGLRLALYLTWRNWGEPEDSRYAAMRRHHGDRFVWVSLATVFGLQGLLMWIVSLPVQAAIVAPAGAVGWLDAVAAALWCCGWLFESFGDLQLARFKADPANRGRVMDRGLWAWTRHPNYFGDFCVWWAFGAFAVAAGAWWTLVGPLVMSVLLMKVSGAALLEKGLHRSKPGYAEYVASTPAFFPRPPRARSSRTP